MRLIINADDCGKDVGVNEAIEKFIVAGKLTSTTVMANMHDLPGAVNLYKKYGHNVSFGVHLNLTEGQPLIQSTLLLGKGLYVETDNGIEFNVNAFRNKIFPRNVAKALTQELDAQIEKVQGAGIQLSHIDSHHHIHTSPAMLGILPYLAKRHKITKIRRLRNYIPGHYSFNTMCRDFWWFIIKLQNFDIKTTDYFGIFDEWDRCNVTGGGRVLGTDKVLELMCHPGGIYKEESDKLWKTDFEKITALKLVSYNEIK